MMFIKILELAILTAFMSGCTDDWVSWDEHTPRITGNVLKLLD